MIRGLEDLDKIRNRKLLPACADTMEYFRLDTLMAVDFMVIGSGCVGEHLHKLL